MTDFNSGLVPDPIADADALVRSGDAPRAVALLRSLIESGRGGLLTRMALGRALLAAGDSKAALDILREASSLAPDISDVALALGDALIAAGHMPTAIAEYQRAVRLDPASAIARFKLGCAWLEAGEPARALEFFSELEDIDGLAEKRSESEAQMAAGRMPAGYVRHLFDQFAADYDMRMLQHLHYSAPLHLRALADLVLAAYEKPLTMLDLGCGSGLSGAAFADMTEGGRLDGIDLSPRMIDAARARGIYNELHVADLESALAGEGIAYDVVLAADTLVYLGDLNAVFSGAFRRLNQRGFFLFTVERSENADYELGPKRRYRHSEAYLRRLAEEAGFDIGGLVACHPRSEAGVPVEGLAVALEKV
jgi:predicted TPR repeat methyltransferase